MTRIIVLGSAKRLTLASTSGPFLEGVDPTDRWGA